MKLDFAVLLPYWPVFASGFLLTLLASGLGLVFSLIGGTVMALVRLSRNRVAAGAVVALIEIVRDLPFMVILILMFYLLPAIGIRLPAFGIGVFALSLCSAAYFAEIIRGAILSVRRGQMDSARAMGMSRNQAFRYVIFPQMMGYFVPPATNQAIMIVKDSAILSTITVMELTLSGTIVMNATYTPIEIFTVVSLLYCSVCTCISHAGKRLESRLSVRWQVPVARKRLLDAGRS